MEDAKREIIKHLAEGMRIRENTKYGQFILQTNEVQFYLKWLILLRSTYPTKKLRNFLERAEFGTLISCFRICVRYSERQILKSLELYKDSRDALAHKMFSNRRLTVAECEKSFELGVELLTRLREWNEKEMFSIR